MSLSIVCILADNCSISHSFPGLRSTCFLSLIFKHIALDLSRRNSTAVKNDYDYDATNTHAHKIMPYHTKPNRIIKFYFPCILFVFCSHVAFTFNPSARSIQYRFSYEIESTVSPSIVLLSPRCYNCCRFRFLVNVRFDSIRFNIINNNNKQRQIQLEGIVGCTYQLR